MKDYKLENRRFIIGGIAFTIVIVYMIRLFTLQLLSDDYKKNADSNAFLKKIEYPSRGVINDRNGELLVYNQPAYDVMVVMNEAKDRIDTTEFCQALGITKEFFVKRMETIKDRSLNPGYSRFTQQLFMNQLSDKESSVFQEKIFRFPGFYVQKRSIRQYMYPFAAHVLGDVGEVSPADIEEDEYYQPGDYIGKLGVERYYEKALRGEKGVRVLLRDAHGRIQGKYQNGRYDKRPVAGKDLTLSLDIKLQALGERLLEGKIGSIVAIEPSTGEVLCMVSSPTYDPRRLVGRKRGKMHKYLARNVWKPLLNRSIMGQYPPGSTFKTTQGLTYLSEGIITPHTMFQCHHGFYYRGLHVGCHGHVSPLNLVEAISTSCNAYFCWGLYYMMGNRRKYSNVDIAMDTWRDYMVSMGFGYRLGIDLPGEKRGSYPTRSSTTRLTRVVERPYGHQYLHRTGRSQPHAAANSQPRRDDSQPRLLLRAACGEKSAGRTARHGLHPPALHQGQPPRLRLHRGRNAVVRAERNLQTPRPSRLPRMRKDRNGAEPGPGPLRLHGLRADGKPQDCHRRLRGERRIRRRLRRTDSRRTL